MSLISVNIPLSFILTSVLKLGHRPCFFDNVRLIILISLHPILKFRKTLSDCLHSCSLFFKLLWLHLYVNSSSGQQTLRHLETVDRLDHSTSNESSYQRLHFDYEPNWNLVELLFVFETFIEHIHIRIILSLIAAARITH